MGKKKKLLSKNFMSWFIIIIMVLSVIGFMYGSHTTDNDYGYNGYSFIRQSNKWVVEYNNEKLVFDFHPSQVENINLSSDVIVIFDNIIQIDSTADVDDSNIEAIALSQYMIQDIFDKTSGAYLRRGRTSENEFDFPMIDCGKFLLNNCQLNKQKANETKVSLEESCVIIEAKSDIDVRRAKDRVLYGFLGIIS